MASIVKFKFKSAREYDSVSFPGTGIKLLDLKRAIVEQKKLHQGMEFDLNIVNDKTREEYKEDNVVVTKNTSVTVKRVPAPKSGGLLSKIKALDAAAALRATATATTTTSTNSASAGDGGSGAASGSGPGAAGAGGPSNGNAAGPKTVADEEAAIDALNQQAGSMRHGFANRRWTADGAGTGPNRTMTFGRGGGPAGGGPGGRGGRGPAGATAPPGMDGMGPGRGGGRGGGGPPGRGGGFGMGRGGRGGGAPQGPLPPNYVCRRCFKPGHFIQDCPTNNDSSYDNTRLKRVVGIPTSMIKLSDGDRQGGGLVNASGQLVTIRANDQAFRKLKEFGGGQSVQGLLDRLSESAPKHLKCPICSKIMSDAVILPCCAKSTCDSCVRRALNASASMSCPLCQTRGVGPDSLLPNESLRAGVDEYLTRVTRESRGKAGNDRAASERLQEDANRQKKQEEAAAAAGTSSASGAAGVGGGAGGSNKRKRPPQKGVDAILDLEPREEEEAAEEEEEEEDPFGNDVYDVQAQPLEEEEKKDGQEGEQETKKTGDEGGQQQQQQQQQQQRGNDAGGNDNHAISNRDFGNGGSGGMAPDGRLYQHQHQQDGMGNRGPGGGGPLPQQQQQQQLRPHPDHLQQRPHAFGEDQFHPQQQQPQRPQGFGGPPAPPGVPVDDRGFARGGGGPGPGMGMDMGPGGNMGGFMNNNNSSNNGGHVGMRGGPPPRGMMGPPPLHGRPG
ncbi:unnamed protein product, partial [Ectocarpus sp. 12 AP-2014]